jgi:5-methyltetrahydrofolate--homocysteine methyltransferase
MAGTKEQIREAIVAGLVDDVKALTLKAIEEKANPEELLEIMKEAMTVVGDKYADGTYYIPDMLVGAMAMQAGMAELKPLLAKADVQMVGTVIAFAVEGDVHDIGKNLVCMYYEGAGFEVVDLGVDVSADKAIAAIKEHDADIVSISALISTTRANMPNSIRAIRESGVDVKVMVGGAPVTQDFADAIGADGYAEDAGGAARKALELMGAG